MNIKHSLRFWLISGTLLIVIAIAAGFTANRYYVKKEVEQYAEKFELLSILRRNAMENYFDTVSAEIRFWAINPELLRYQSEIIDVWREYQKNTGDPELALRGMYITDNPFPGKKRDFLGPEQDLPYANFHRRFQPFASKFVSERDYYDLFLISPEGNIFYSVEKENDFATNLVNGPYQESGLASVFKQAMARAADKKFVAFSDIEPYSPSNDVPAMFMAKALLNDQGELLGVLALQLPMSQLRNVMNFTAGMGDSGETFLVGKDRLMRSDSRFSTSSTILKVSVETDTVEKALKGRHGVEFTKDYRGIEVLSAYTSLDFNGIRWAVLAEIDKAEVLQQMASRQPAILGLTGLLYALAMWSLWLIRPGDWQDQGSILSSSSTNDFGDTAS
jgi:methyl-accepting chemotaxis protein